MVACVNLFKEPAFLKLTTVSNDDFLAGLATLVAECFDLLDDIHTFGDSAENNVTVVQPGGFHCCHEELRSIGVWTGVGLNE